MLPPRGAFVVVVVVVADKKAAGMGETGADKLESSPLRDPCCQLMRGKGGMPESEGLAAAAAAWR